MSVSADQEQPAPIVVLWTKSSGYLLACLEALAVTSRRPVILVCFRASGEAPFANSPASSIKTFDAADESSWRPLVDAAAGLLVCGWHVWSFRRAARRASKSVETVLFFDNQWRGGLRQQMARVIAPVFLAPAYSACFVPGRRQAEFAKRLGYGRRPLRLGAYSADVAHFSSATPLTAETAPARRRFVFVGRANPVKGLDTLGAAYANYRTTVSQPWELLLVGQGHDSSVLAAAPGVVCLPFVQPIDLPQILQQASCFVMPSRFEPWGVALHEAAAAGLVLIASSEVGSGDVFIHDGENGRLFEPGDVAGLAAALALVSDLSADALEAASNMSRELSLAVTPESWAVTLLDLLQLGVTTLAS